MDRVFESGASASPPAAPASPSTGYPQAGNPGASIAATKPGPYWYHMITESLRQLVLDAGLTPNHLDLTLVSKAVQALITGATGNDYKASVRVATTANIASLNGGAPNTLDGIALAANNRILVKDQATPSQNGIYYVATLGTGANGIWLRAVDADGAGELSPGTLVVVEEGTAQADTLWLLSTDGPITIGTTGIQFVRRDSGAANTNQLASGSVTASAGALTATLDPSTTDFRSTTATSGARSSVTSASALSLVVPSGATLGVPANTSARLYVLELNNAGVKEPAIVYQTGGISLNEEGVISTTALSGGSNSANVVYSAVARASVAYRVRLYFDVTLSVPGTWINPTRVQPVGGQAGAALQSYGVGQTWQSVSRTNGVTYYNNTDKAITFKCVGHVAGGTLNSTVSINGGAAFTFMYGILVSGFGWGVGDVVIPPGASYVFSALPSSSILTMQELR